MNNCNIIGQIVNQPQLRYTNDNQLAVTDLILEFDLPSGSRPDGRSAKPTIEVVGWGALAAEMADLHKIGDYIIVEGRLEMNSIEKDGGYKEKKARLVATKIHQSSKPVDVTYTPPASTSKQIQSSSSKSAKSVVEDDDYIPF